MVAMQPLAGVRVLDLSTGLAGPFCARILGDLGADVLKVEPPGGDPARRLAPFAGDDPHPDKGLTFLFRNVNKRGTVLDLASDEGRAALAELLADADLVVDSAQPGDPTYLLEGGMEIPESVVWLSITPFGLTGPYRSWRSSDLISYAMGGMVWPLGDQSRPPLKHGLYQAANETALHAAVAALGALRHRERTGRGQRVEVSAQEVNASVLQGKVLDYSYMGMVNIRFPASEGLLTAGTIPTADGEIVAQFTQTTTTTWEMWASFLEEPALLDPKFSDHAGRIAHQDELNEILLRVFARRGRHEWFHAAQEWRLTYGVVQTAEDLLRCPQLAARGFFISGTQPAIGAYTMPGALYKSTAPAFAHRLPAPLLPDGEAGGQGEAGWTTDEGRRTTGSDVGPRPPRHPVTPSPRLPLAGVRIIECGHSYAIPHATRLLADLGAEVIKIESPTRPDPSRAGAYPEGVPAKEYWNQGSIHHEQNRNKRNFGLNLQTEEGKALFCELIKTADIFAENNAPRVMPNFGLAYEDLRKVKPDLIYISSSGYGQSGPWTHYVAWGMTMEPTGGLSYLTGYPDGPPVRSWTGYGADMPAAAVAAVAMLAALRHRDRTGEGQYIDLAQYEVTVNLVGEAVLEYSVNGRVMRRIGNRDLNRAPQGVYRCAGRENWVAISVGDDAEWAALCAVIGRPELAADPRFATSEGRRAHHDLLDEVIEGWTAERDRWEVAHALQARGVPAGPVFNNKDILVDPHLVARGFGRRVRMHPRAEGLDRRVQIGPMWHFSETPVEVRWGAPVMGQDNEYVLLELLGRPPSDIERLREAGVVDITPPPGFIMPNPTMALTVEQQVATGRALAYEPDYKEVLARLYGPA